MQKIKNLNKSDLKKISSYYGKTFLYSFLIGSAVIAVAKNYKKAMMNEEIFSMYKYFRSIEGEHKNEDFIH